MEISVRCGRRDLRPWRKVVKKLRRKRKRQQRVLLESVSTVEADNPDPCDLEVDRTFFISESEWALRDKEAEAISQLKLADEEMKRKAREDEERMIREEWEEREKADNVAKEEERQKMKKKARRETILLMEEEFNEYLDFLCGDIETPPQPYVMPEVVEDGRELCHLFVKTGACRFFERCKLAHPSPILSQTILISNFFTHFLLQEGLRDEYDMDIGLEYEKSDLYKEFIEFYDDVLPEFRKHGTILQFKVCCNFESHLRGNVYIQFENIRSALEAFRTFNGRFFNGRQLSLRFVRIESWRTAICWSFLRRSCIKGGHCNYLHVFRNPTKEFVQADRDWKEMPMARGLGHSPKLRPQTSSTSVLSHTVSTKAQDQAQGDGAIPGPVTATALTLQPSNSISEDAPTSSTRNKQERKKEHQSRYRSRSRSKHKKKKKKHKSHKKASKQKD